ncbi:MAG: NAD-dependent epimerase/dehydratase family protein [Pyrinomonadaceae bacterium]
MIIVTGATGFIGTRVIAKLAEQHPAEDIICLVRAVTNKREAHGREILANLNLKTIEVDLVTGKGLEQVPRSPELVINLAANTDTEDGDHSCNDAGVQNLYQAIQPLRASTHFLQVSTTALFAGRRNASVPFSEETRPVATNEYGRSKLRGEEFIIRQAAVQNFCLTICRLTTVWGKGMRENSFFDVLRKKVLERSVATRLNWPGLTDLIHVDDTAELIVKLSGRRAHPGIPGVYTLSTEAMTLAEVNQLIHGKLGLQFKQINLPRTFWMITAASRPLIHSLERLIPARFYNPLWRATLVSDNVIYADTSKIKEAYPGRKPKLLADYIDDVL